MRSMDSDIEFVGERLRDKVGRLLNNGLILLGAGSLAWLIQRLLRAYYYGYAHVWAVAVATVMIAGLSLWLWTSPWARRHVRSIALFLFGIALVRALIHGPL
jgi:hypothetical protein